MGTKYHRNQYREARTGAFRRLGDSEPKIGSRALVLRFFIIYGLIGAMVMLGLVSRDLAGGKGTAEYPGVVTSKTAANGAAQASPSISFRVTTADGDIAEHAIGVTPVLWRSLEVGSSIYATFETRRSGDVLTPLTIRPAETETLGTNEQPGLFEAIPLSNAESLPPPAEVP